MAKSITEVLLNKIKKTFIPQDKFITSEGVVVPVESVPEVFFRYVRGIDELTYDTATFGGVTFLIHLDAKNNSFKFSMAYCSDERFDKSIGRNICVNRMGNEEFFEVKDMDPTISLISNIYLAFRKYILKKERNDDILHKPYISTAPIHKKHCIVEMKKVFKYIAKNYEPGDTMSYLAVLQ